MASVEFDPKVNAVYIRIREGKVEESDPLADNIVMDLDKYGEVVGLEILLPSLDDKQLKAVSEALKNTVEV
jgi:uncharacterized protein YuzE